MALRMSTPLLFITSSFLFLLSAFSICRNGVNCHSHWFHFIPSICQRVECECVCTWLVGTKCTRDFPAREMVIFRRQELIIRLCHPFRSLNVDPTWFLLPGCLPRTGLPSVLLSLPHPPPENAHQMLRRAPRFYHPRRI